ncbi:MAG: EVE domain-containing protein [Ignavibacteriales bacterium]|nr:EVE domain-containing protein [Ignavibacteriales bacterium]
MNCLTMNLVENRKLQKMRLVRPGNRLSVMPVEKEEFEEIVKLGK